MSASTLKPVMFLTQNTNGRSSLAWRKNERSSLAWRGSFFNQLRMLKFLRILASFNRPSCHQRWNQPFCLLSDLTGPVMYPMNSNAWSVMSLNTENVRYATKQSLLLKTLWPRKWGMFGTQRSTSLQVAKRKGQKPVMRSSRIVEKTGACAIEDPSSR